MIIQPKWHQDPAGFYKPLSHQILTVSSSVVSPTRPVNARIARVFFRLETVRVTFDGVNPVAATTGVPFSDGYEELLSLHELDAMKLIRDGGTDAEVHFIYYG